MKSAVRGLSWRWVRFVLLVGLGLSLCALPAVALKEAADGSVCFNQCSGHGECVDYSCHCYAGYVGDDCSTTFADESNLVPILTAGSFNVTKKNFTQTISKNPMILVGFSAYSCHKCIAYEPTYLSVANKLTEKKIPFARADAEKLKAVAAEYGATELPALVFIHKMKPVLYKGVHSEAAILQFISKLTSPPVKRLQTVGEVDKFLNSRSQPEFSVSTVMTVGFFSEHEDIEEDEYAEFVDAAKALQSNEDLYFGVVTSAKVSKHYKQNRSIDRTPSVMMVGEGGERHSTNLDELFGEQQGLREWLLARSIPLVGKITNRNFGLYEKAQKPMLLMFLDLTDEMHTSQPGRVLGGKSGGLLNEHLVEELRQIAKEYSDRLLFGYLDGTLYEDQMKSLGLFGGRERLPSLAFNTRDGKRVPFPEELPINYDTLNQFCADFISGKLRNAGDLQKMAQKALQRAVPISAKNQAQRQKVRAAPEVVQGVSEQFGDGKLGDEAIVTVTSSNFDEVAMNDETDVVLLLHAQECVSCAHFAVYFKRMARRFRELGIPSLVVARMDVTTDSPPAHLQMMAGPLPLLLMLPAGQRQPPWTFFSGVGKVQELMKWVAAHAGVPFELPNLPHLVETDRVLYKEQVRQREEALEQRREDERRAMEEEERAQAAFRSAQPAAPVTHDEDAYEGDEAPLAWLAGSTGTSVGVGFDEGDEF